MFLSFHVHVFERIHTLQISRLFRAGSSLTFRQLLLLQKTDLRLRLTSRNIWNLSFALSAVNQLNYAAQKMMFPLRISSVNVTKSARNCGFDHIY